MVKEEILVFCLAYSDEAPVVQNLDNAIHRINHHPLDSAIGFAMTYPLDGDLPSR